MPAAIAQLPSTLTRPLVLWTIAVGATLLVADDPLTALAVAVLALGWTWLAGRPGERSGPPILPAVFTLRWAQATAVLIYAELTGRRVFEMRHCNYRAIIALHLGCLVALAIGLKAGQYLLRHRQRRAEVSLSLSLSGFALCAVGYVVLGASRFSLRAAVESGDFGGLTQLIYSITFLRLACLYVVLHGLIHPRPRWAWVALLMLAEVVLGLATGSSAFKEPLLIATLVLVSEFRSRRAGHWIALFTLSASVIALSVVWAGIKPVVRRATRADGADRSMVERLERVEAATLEWLGRDTAVWVTNVDALVSRAWVGYYQAKAFMRVPETVPHENGRLMGMTLDHVFKPRLFFPDKPTLDDSDTMEVRHYAGVWVAGKKEGTSIAFGHDGESYVDFGISGMFGFELLLGVLMGLVYAGGFALLRGREIAQALVATAMLQTLGSVEVSWTKLLGGAITLFVVFGAVGWALDRLLMRRPAPAPPPGASGSAAG